MASKTNMYASPGFNCDDPEKVDVEALVTEEEESPPRLKGFFDLNKLDANLVKMGAGIQQHKDSDASSSLAQSQQSNFDLKQLKQSILDETKPEIKRQSETAREVRKESLEGREESPDTTRQTRKRWKADRRSKRS